MHPFHWIDWLVAVLPFAVVVAIGWRIQRHLRAVADFTSGGRVAGRYVLCVASGEAGLGLISVVGLWEMYYNSGFGVAFWSGFTGIVWLFLNLFGYCTYRFRETRCLTMAQFFEVRYNRGVRLYSGFVSVISGIMNYAIFPAVGARFIMYFANLPARVEIFGVGFTTYGLLLGLCLGAAFAMVWFGGQLTIMVTDCTQGILGFWMYLAIGIALFTLLSWETVADALVRLPPPGKSMVNPFDIGDYSDFNIYYILIGLFGGVLNRISWQGAQGYNSAAANAHEAKMAGILGAWRGSFVFMMLVLLAIVGYTYMNHPDFAPYAERVNDILAERTDNPAIASQMRVPMVISELLPVGITGLFFASMVLLMVSTDNTYMHSWGTILFQDCLMPFMKRRLPPKTHIMGLRMSVLFVAVFAWVFSYYFGQTTYVLMFFALTGTIYLGGAGPAIVGGLYWKRGTSAGAVASLTAGVVLGGLGMVLGQPACWRPVARWLHEDLGVAAVEPYLRKFPVNGQWIYFIAMVASLALYVVVSLLTGRGRFNLARMLHRGAYAKDGEGTKAGFGRRSVDAFLGITGEFSRGDRFITRAIFCWSVCSWLVWISAVSCNVLFGYWTPSGWLRYFFVMSLVLPTFIGTVTIVWFTIGGIAGLRDLFAKIRTLPRDEQDDGRVVGHTPAEDLVHADGGRGLIDPATGRVDPDSRPAPSPERLPRLYIPAALGLVAALALPWAGWTESGPEGPAARRVLGAELPFVSGLDGRLRLALARQRLAEIADQQADGQREAARLAEDRNRARDAWRTTEARFRAVWPDMEETVPAPVTAAASVPEARREEFHALRRTWRQAAEQHRHAAAAADDHAERAQRLAAKAERVAEECADLGNISPDRPWAAALIFLGPLLALAGIWVGRRGRIRNASRLGLAAALATAATLGLGMLLYPESLGGLLGLGVPTAMVSAFLLLAISATTLTVLDETGRVSPAKE